MKQLHALLVVVTADLQVMTVQTILEDLDVTYTKVLAEDVKSAKGPCDMIIQIGLGEKEKAEIGLAVLKELRKNFFSEPILVMSTHDEAADRALRAGANLFFHRLNFWHVHVEVIEKLIKLVKTASR